MDERIKKLRKALDLTQREFAERIGMKANTIATYEMGRAVPSDPTINNICKEFGVSEKWLRTGEGSMMAPAPTSALDALAAERHLSHGDYVFIEKLLEMKPEKRQAALEFMVDFAKDILGGGVALDAPALGEGPPDVEDLEAQADAFAAMAREQFLSEKKREAQASFVKESDAG